MKTSQSRLRILILILVSVNIMLSIMDLKPVIAQNATSIGFNYSGNILIGDPFGTCHGAASNPQDAQGMKIQGVEFSRDDLPWSFHRTQ